MKTLPKGKRSGEPTFDACLIGLISPPGLNTDGVLPLKNDLIGDVEGLFPSQRLVFGVLFWRSYEVTVQRSLAGLDVV